MSKVFVVDTTKQVLDPVHPAQARLLLTQGKAAVFRRYPFTIILKRAVEHPQRQPLRLKIDPGSKTTGLALVNDATGEVVWAAELSQNRLRHKAGWLPPSLQSRIATTLTWVARLQCYAPITALSVELVKFDTHLLDNPALSGVEYQQGTLAGYELREYLLEKWGRHCAYCGAEDVQLQIEHIHPRAKGGANRERNLTLACEPCNRNKGTQDIREFLGNKPDVLTRLLAQAQTPLKDAAAMNAARWELYRRLQATLLPVECGTGGHTKFNRTQRTLPKTHWLDAACIGASTPAVLHIQALQPLFIKAMGHGSRQMCRMSRYGFPRTGPKQARVVKGFQTGDIVKAIVPTGKKQGTYLGRVAVRKSGSFNIATPQGTIQGISHRFCRIVHHCDGYQYTKGERAFPPIA